MHLLRPVAPILLGAALLALAVPAVAPELVLPPDEVVGDPCQVTHGQRVHMTGVLADEFAFEPADVTEPLGTVVTWIDLSPGIVIHTTTSDDGFWDSGNMVVGQTYSVQFCVAGVFAYRCVFHPGLMHGTVTVTAP